MNRRSFFSLCGLGAAGAALAPLECLKAVLPPADSPLEAALREAGYYEMVSPQLQRQWDEFARNPAVQAWVRDQLIYGVPTFSMQRCPVGELDVQEMRRWIGADS